MMLQPCCCSPDAATLMLQEGSLSLIADRATLLQAVPLQAMPHCRPCHCRQRHCTLQAVPHCKLCHCRPCHIVGCAPLLAVPLLAVPYCSSYHTPFLCCAAVVHDHSFVIKLLYTRSLIAGCATVHSVPLQAVPLHHAQAPCSSITSAISSFVFTTGSTIAVPHCSATL